MGQTTNFHRELTLFRRSVGMGMVLTALLLLLPVVLVSPMEIGEEETQTIQVKCSSFFRRWLTLILP